MGLASHRGARRPPLPVHRRTRQTLARLAGHASASRRRRQSRKGVATNATEPRPRLETAGTRGVRPRRHRPAVIVGDALRRSLEGPILELDREPRSRSLQAGRASWRTGGKDGWTGSSARRAEADIERGRSCRLRRAGQAPARRVASVALAQGEDTTRKRGRGGLRHRRARPRAGGPGGEGRLHEAREWSLVPEREADEEAAARSGAQIRSTAGRCDEGARRRSTAVRCRLHLSRRQLHGTPTFRRPYRSDSRPARSGRAAGGSPCTVRARPPLRCSNSELETLARHAARSVG